MLSNFIWVAGVALEALLLIRGWKVGLLRRYPIFYGYIAFVLLQGLPLYAAQTRGREVYTYTFWTFEYLGIAAGCAVVYEIYKLALDSYPGAARIARNALMFVFAMVFAKGLANGVNMHKVWDEVGALGVERMVRTVQAVALLSLVILFLVYSIPFGKNLRGILLGYSVFIAVRVICLVFVPPKGHDFWFYAYSGSYAVVLSLWLAHLWAYGPVPQAQTRGNLARDYQALAAETRRRFREAAGFFRKAARS